jgi:hypothetical protein
MQELSRGAAFVELEATRVSKKLPVIIAILKLFKIIAVAAAMT